VTDLHDSHLKAFSPRIYFFILVNLILLLHVYALMISCFLLMTAVLLVLRE